MQDAPARRPALPGKFDWHLPCTGVRPGVTRMDLIFVFAAIAFFAVSLAYVSGCDRL
jgi:hypothetical protein